MVIEYRDNINGVAIESKGFFIGWQSKPSNKMFKAILCESDYVIVAVDMKTQKLAGFITAITDGVISAYISFLEVRLEYQRQGLGTQLLKKMLSCLDDLYMIDLICDPNIKAFYERFGLRESLGMSIRNYEHQRGRDTINASRPLITRKIHSRRKS
jgi:ribosomal protein S18 acetylase RimI-like enzyme